MLGGPWFEPRSCFCGYGTVTCRLQRMYPRDDRQACGYIRYTETAPDFSLPLHFSRELRYLSICWTSISPCSSDPLML